MTLGELRKFSIDRVFSIVSRDTRWTARTKKRYNKRNTDEERRKYLLGLYECWLEEAKRKARFKQRFVTGGLVNPK